MEKEIIVWNNILSAVMRMPGVRVNRDAFLRKELKGYCNEQELEILDHVRPYSIVSDKTIDAVASSCIKFHTAMATTGSTIAGLPGGLALAATIPGDITQYYFHVVVLSQKLAYLYGFPDFFQSQDEQEELNDVACDMLTIFLGSMMGVKVADQGITEMAKGVAKTAIGRLPRLVITKTIIYPIAIQVAKLIGAKLSREGLTKTIGKFIPIAGGFFSGALTLFTFKPGADRLQKRLKAQKKYFKNSDEEALKLFWEEDGKKERTVIRSAFVKAEQTQDNPVLKQLALAQAVINMANISDNISPDVQDVVEEYIAKSDLPNDQQIALLEHLGTEYSLDVDYDMLGCDPDYAIKALKAMNEVMQTAGRKTMAEKMYLSMVAKAVGVSKEELDELVSEKKEEKPEPKKNTE
jgi:hypothetical protein